MNSKEILDKMRKLQEEAAPLSTMEADKMSDEQRTELTNKSNELTALMKELRTVAEQENIQRIKAEAGEGISVEDKRTFERYSFRNAFNAAAGFTKLDGIEKEMHDEAIRETKESGRSFNGTIGIPYVMLQNKKLVQSRASTGQSTTVGAGGYLINDEPVNYFAGLRNALVLPGLGAQVINGLKGDLPFAEGNLFTASWLGEDDTDTTTALTFTSKTGTPHRLQATGAFSRQLLLQSSPDIEMLLQNELISANALAIQDGAINGEGSDEPTGIISTVGIGSVVGGTNGLAPTWAHIVKLEQEVWQDNAMGPSMAYLTNAKVRGKLKQTEKTSANGQYIWDPDNTLNGYPVGVTNVVPSDITKASGSALSAIIFGNFSKLFMLSWGGLEIIADPYSLKKKAEIEVTVISYNDVVVQNAAAFAAMLDAITV